MATLTTRQQVDAILTAQHRGDAFPGDYLDTLCGNAEEIVNNIRLTDVIEDRYVHVAARIAMYWVEKLGYNGAKSISENGVSRSYEQGDVPDSLLRLIIPTARVK